MTTITALPTPPSRSDPANFATRGDALLTALPAFVTQTNAVAGEVNTNATTATTQAGIATTQAGIATTQAATATIQAGIATTQAGLSTTNGANQVALAAAQVVLATTQAGNALSSANAAAASYDAFDDRYLGSKSSNPATDNDGGALIEGSLHWNSTANEMRVYDGAAWTAAYVPNGDYLTGPDTSTDGAYALFDGATGRILKNGGPPSSKQDVLVSGTSIKTINSTSLLGSGNITVGSQINYESRSSNTVLSAADLGKLIDFTNAAFTQTFTAAGTLGAGWFVYLRNLSTNQVTLDPNASETIDGVVSGALKPGMMLLVICTGTAFHCVRVGPQTVLEVLTSGTSWTCPLGVRTIKVTGTGGGASGLKGSSSFTINGAGGAGATFIANIGVAPGTAYTYALGAGGSAKTSDGAGNSGGTTTFTANGITRSAPGGRGGSIADSPISSATNGDINLTTSHGASGGGNSSYWGGGGPEIVTTGPAPIANYGSGGARGITPLNSGAGTAGVIVVEY